MNLLEFPKKTEAGVVVHCYFTDAGSWHCVPLFVCGKPSPRAEMLPHILVSQRPCWVEKEPHVGDCAEREENRDQVIVFAGDTYGIFHMAELVVLMGMCLRELPSHLGSREAILAWLRNQPRISDAG